jgi:hypothetical protein
MALPGVDDGERLVPVEELLPYAKHDSILAGMIRRGVPLTRSAYLMQNWGGELPQGEDWTSEHEDALPEPFQLPEPR